MRFRLVVHDTDEDNKYAANKVYEYFGTRDSIWHLWYVMKKTLNQKHVEVFALDGVKQCPEDGLHGLVDYNP